MNNSIYSEIFLRKKIPLLYNLIAFMFLILIIIIIIILNMNYYSSIKTIGIIEELDNNYYLKLVIEDKEIKYLINNNYLYLEKEIYYYKIYKIDEELYSKNNKNYKIIYLKIKLNKEYKINNLNLNIKINKENKKIINYIIDYLRKDD